MRTTDVKIIGAKLFLLPVKMRVPLKFGAQQVDSICCARVQLTVSGRDGRRADGWGETPLSAGWAWPSPLPFLERENLMKEFCRILCEAYAGFDAWGHPIELGTDFNTSALEAERRKFSAALPEEFPYLAALVCASAFDAALADAYGRLHAIPFFRTCNEKFMSRDLAELTDGAAFFEKKFPEEFFVPAPPDELPVWHLVGGKDPLTSSELTGEEPDDGYPVLLTDWIKRDGLKCLKIKLRGNDTEWDYARTVATGKLALPLGVTDLSVDFNCQVTDPDYVNAVLDRLKREEPEIHAALLYVEQPFPYELEAHRIDVHSVSARKMLFMDESAHDWKFIDLGRELGWDAVALKSCKTLSGAILSLCRAKAHGMKLMVQDLTNPRLSMLAHVQLAAYAGTIRGVECNAPQFYPAASIFEESVYPGLYERRNGVVKAGMLSEPGLGVREKIVHIALPEPAAVKGEIS